MDNSVKEARWLFAFVGAVFAVVATLGAIAASVNDNGAATGNMVARVDSANG